MLAHTWASHLFCFASRESHLSHYFCQILNTVLNKMFCAVPTGPPLPHFELLNNPCILSVLHHCPFDTLPPLIPETPRRVGSPPLVSNLLTQSFLSVALFSSSLIIQSWPTYVRNSPPKAWFLTLNIQLIFFLALLSAFSSLLIFACNVFNPVFKTLKKIQHTYFIRDLEALLLLLIPADSLLLSAPNFPLHSHVVSVECW